jgi:hypothetical protein
MCGSFSDAVSSSDYKLRMIGLLINSKGYVRNRSWHNLSYCPRICDEGLRRATKNLSEDNLPLRRNLNLVCTEYEGVLTRSRLSNVIDHYNPCRITMAIPLPSHKGQSCVRTHHSHLLIYFGAFLELWFITMSMMQL